MSVESPEIDAEPAVLPRRQRRGMQWWIRRLWRQVGKRFKQLTSPMPPIGVEIGVVLLLCYLPGLVSSVHSFLLSPVPHASFGNSLYSLLIGGFPQLIAVLFIASRAGVSRQRIGIIRPVVGWDIFGGAATLGLIFTVMWVRRTLLSTLTPAFHHFLLHDSSLHFAGAREVPGSAFTWSLAAIYSLCVGFREEFIYRGYLLARLQDWFGSRWFALLVSSILFASIHIYEGYYGMLSAFLFGLAMGLVMLTTRRLYAVALAHAAWDFLIMTGIY